jgi:SAM-dependent methyltransferase
MRSLFELVVDLTQNLAAEGPSTIELEQSEWPSSDKEFLGHCPVCKSKNKRILYDGVRDRVFGAPGTWTLRRCIDCDIVYLDPRPSRTSIGIAYATYYTHMDEPFAPPLQGAGKFLKEMVQRAIDVRDYFFVKSVWPRDSIGCRMLGPIFEKLAPRAIAAIAFKLRHLQPAEREDACFLDIGCGDGAFLRIAEMLGYAALGLEPDPVAVERGKTMGRKVRLGSLEANDFAVNSFDQVTLSHVLEHFHDTVAALDEVYRLLRPGGRVWITQPNIGALGLAEFGASWRGLETPRHMVLMTPSRLIELLKSRSFVRCEQLKPSYEAMFFFSQSLMISRGENPNPRDGKGWSPVWRDKARAADALAFTNPAVSECMTVVAHKPW